MANHGNSIDITVVECNRLIDMEGIISRQDPYVVLEYGDTRNRTRVCTDGGRNPTFKEKFTIHVVEGSSELYITVWNNNTIARDDFIGSVRVHLGRVLSQGSDDRSWALLTQHGRPAGEIQLRMTCPNAKANVPPAPVSVYSTPPSPAGMFYPSAATGAYPMPSVYQPQPAPYLPQSYPPNSVYAPHQPSPYPPQPYPPSSDYPPHQPAPYPLQPYPYNPVYLPQQAPYTPQPLPPNSIYSPQSYGGANYPHGFPHLGRYPF